MALITDAVEPGRIYHTVLDGITKGLVSINYIHHKIHEECGYTASKVFTHGAGASPNILIVAPNTTKRVHLVYNIISDAVLQVDFYKDPDYSGGAAVAATNRDLNSSSAAGLTLTSDASDDGSGKGSLIWTFKAGANKTVTAAENDRFEFILKQNTKYLLEAIGANGDLITALFDWYEHTNKVG